MKLNVSLGHKVHYRYPTYFGFNLSNFFKYRRHLGCEIFNRNEGKESRREMQELSTTVNHGCQSTSTFNNTFPVFLNERQNHESDF